MSQPGCRDRRKSLFLEPSGLCGCNNLLFVCDSGNASIKVLDVARLVSRKKTAHTLGVSTSESEEKEDDIPLTGKYTITSTLALTSTCGIHLVRPLSVCSGRRIMQDYPDFYVCDTKQGKVFKITDVKLTTQCSGSISRISISGTISSSCSQHQCCSSGTRLLPRTIVYC